MTIKKIPQMRIKTNSCSRSKVPIRNPNERLDEIRLILADSADMNNKNVNYYKIRYYILIFVTVICLSTCFIYYSTNTLPILKQIFSNSPYNQLFFKSQNPSDLVLSELETCKIPKLDPFNHEILEYIRTPPKLNCSANFPEIFISDYDSKIVQLRSLGPGIQCCYRIIERGAFSDNKIKMSKRCFPMTMTSNSNVTMISQTCEFIHITCRNISKSNRSIIAQDMFSFVPLKPKVENRIHQINILKKSDNFTNANEKFNVIILGLDSVSNMNFQRQMPLSYSFLVKQLGAIGLEAYAKVGENTFPNLIPLLTGLNVEELKTICWAKNDMPLDKCPFIWKEFSKKGYRTLMAEDSVWMSGFNYEKKGFKYQPTDYYLNPYTLYMAKEIGHEIWGNSKLCYGPRNGFQILLDYMIKAAWRFSINSTNHKPYFQFIWANSLFHDYLNSPKIGDDQLYQTLQYLNNKNVFSKSIFILLSDHGLRYGNFRNTYQGTVEENMPMAYFLFPQGFHKKFPDKIANFLKNSKRLATPYDVHETLKTILYQNFDNKSSIPSINQRGFSLLNAVIPYNRTCIGAQIPLLWCFCNPIINFSTNSSMVQMFGQFITKSINFNIQKYPQCVKFTQSRVIHGLEKGQDLSNPNLKLLQITVEVLPSKAIFEGTFTSNGSTTDNIKNERYNWILSDNINRLDLYKDQGNCVPEHKLQKFCICKLKNSKAKASSILPVSQKTETELFNKNSVLLKQKV